MSDEPRRSGRATKGQNPKILDNSPVAPRSAQSKAKKQTKNERRRATTPEEDDDDDEDAIIRCICGADVEDSDDERMMICCDQCSSWQHNECMEIPEDEDELPDKYLCEVCAPDNHKELLAKVARGEKPWEERAKERERQALEKKNRKRKGGKKGKAAGKKARTSDVKSEASERAPEESTIVEEPESMMEEARPPTSDGKSKKSTPAKSPPAKPRDGSPLRVPKKRKSRGETAESPAAEAEKEPKAKIRKVTDPPTTQQSSPPRRRSTARTVTPAQSSTTRRSSVAESPTEAPRRRRSSVAETPAEAPRRRRSSAAERSTEARKRRKSSAPKTPPPSKTPPAKKVLQPSQTELVTEVEHLINELRRNTTNLLIKSILDLMPRAEKEGVWTVPEGETATSVATRIALETEHGVHMHYSNVPGEPTTDYRQRFRTMLFNLKKNPALLDGLLQGTLKPSEYATMTTSQMARKELQEENAKMKEELDKQNIIVPEEETKRRMRRTHKGWEFVGDNSDDERVEEPSYSMSSKQRQESAPVVDTSSKETPSATAMSPPTPYSTNASIPESGREAPQTDGAVDTPPARDPREIRLSTTMTKTTTTHHGPTTTFNIQDVWSNVQTPVVEKYREPQPTHEVSATADGGHADDDPEIDRLLKDEEPESPPYSPTDYSSDPSVVWRGRITMPNVATVYASARHVAGATVKPPLTWAQMMPPFIRIDGRIRVERASQYLCELRFSRSTDVVVVALTPSGGVEAQQEFDKLWEYFDDRQKYGVIEKEPGTWVKDAYVMPLEAGTAPLPLFMEMLEDNILAQPRSERIILVTFVIKMPLDEEGAAAPAAGGSATTAHVTEQAEDGDEYQPVLDESWYGPAQAPPPAPASGAGAAPAAVVGDAIPFPPSALTVQQALGGFINSPVIGRILSDTPNLGPAELAIIKEILERVPAAAEDFDLMRGLLIEKSIAGAAAAAAAEA